MHSVSVVTLICLVFTMGSKANTCDGAATQTTTHKGFGAFRYSIGEWADGRRTEFESDGEMKFAGVCMLVRLRSEQD